MYGTNEVFSYQHCAGCGLLFLPNPPADMSRYYPAESYYSMRRGLSTLKRQAMRWRDGSYFHSGVIGSVLADQFPNTALAALSAVSRDRQARILDVGCGSGELLGSLAKLGFRRLYGVDPFLRNTSAPEGVKLLCGFVDDAPGTFDLITFNHSLEHIQQQIETLRAAARKLNDKGTVLVRVPTVDSLAFQIFGENWVQLDAPRHLNLHSRRSLTWAAEAAGLRVSRMYCDSQPFQFWASLLYRDGHSLFAPEAKQYRTRDRNFQRRLARWLNEHDQGDQLVAELRLA